MTAMTEEWVMLWYQCLSENYDYSLYADARVQGDTDTCKEYEKKFEKIAEIYEDFGRLRSLDDLDKSSWEWRAWFEPRKHLFMPDVRVVKPDELAIKDGEILLSVPLQATEAETVAAVALEIKRIYSSQLTVSPKPPKYKLYKVRGNVAHGYQQVKQAVVTSVGKFSDDLDPRRLQPGFTMRDAMTDFLRRHLHELGWGVDVEVERQLEGGDRLDEDSYEELKPRINRSRREFRKLARNVIWGSFPDMRPFDSLVWDRFQKEKNDS